MEVERFYARLVNDGGPAFRPLAAKTVRNTHIVLHRALADAERLRLVVRNVAHLPGVHPKVVSDRLGHATIAVTIDTYSHVAPSLDAEAADTVAADIFGSSA